jgi:CRP-like cAMP-binding protein
MSENSLAPMLDFLRLQEAISGEDAAIISRHVCTRSCKRGEILLKEGQTARELFFITRGILKMMSVNEKGREVVHFFLKEDQFCTVLDSFYNNEPSHIGLVAACDADLVVFPKGQLDQLYEKLPSFKALLDKVIRQRLLDKLRLKNNYAGNDATARYRTFLAEQSDIALRVPLSDIASYLEVTLQSLSRIRSVRNKIS